MNATPHVHGITIGRKYGNGKWQVEYGDTTVRIASRFADIYSWSDEKFERKVGKAVRKAVALHDKGSIEAGRREELEQHRKARVKEWGSSKWATQEEMAKAQAKRDQEREQRVQDLVGLGWSEADARNYTSYSYYYG